MILTTIIIYVAETTELPMFKLNFGFLKNTMSVVQTISALIYLVFFKNWLPQKFFILIYLNLILHYFPCFFICLFLYSLLAFYWKCFIYLFFPHFTQCSLLTLIRILMISIKDQTPFMFKKYYFTTSLLVLSNIKEYNHMSVPLQRRVFISVRLRELGQ